MPISDPSRLGLSPYKRFYAKSKRIYVYGRDFSVDKLFIVLNNTNMIKSVICQFKVDLPSFGLIERYCSNMEITVTKFIRDAVRASLIRVVNNGGIKNTTGLHVNELMPRLRPGRPKKKTEDEDENSKPDLYAPQGDAGIM